MEIPRIRPLALVVFRNGDSIFISKGFDEKKNETFYRPLGGGVDFGETGADAAARELREELSAEIKNLKRLGMIENIFTFNGQAGHELVQIFQAEFVDERFLVQREHEIIENGKLVTTAQWEPLSLFLDHETPMYPRGLLAILEKEWNLG